MVILEVYPVYFRDGFKGLTRKLPFYKEVGFNTVYLMPHWIGGYSPIDLFEVNPRLGTSDDLKEMVHSAHALGMRVLFDMVIHGFNEKSPIPRQRPELFVHDEQGGLTRHRAWRSITTDWASPAYQQYMVDLVLHDLKTYDIDGYRVDAATFKSPSWDPNLPYPAYRSGSAAPELMERMLEAMRKIKPDSVLLSEVFGPVFYTVCNLVHDNQTEAPQFLLEKMETGELNARHYKMHMANVFDALPTGANRVYFARNHDTSWFYHFNGYTRRFMALDAIHALCVIPEVFAGDPKHGPNPDDNPETYDYYRKLFALRKDFPELAKGELLLREVECDNRRIFAGLRRLTSQLVLIIVSLSDKEESLTASIRLASNGIKQNKNLNLIDPISGETIEAKVTEPTAVELKLKPFQVLIGRL
jgi:glycosidase